MNDETDDKMNDDEEFWNELERDNEELDEMLAHLDHLCSGHEFLIFQLENLERLETNLDCIEKQASGLLELKKEAKQFFLGVLWVGAIAAYEGAMHELFLNTLKVEELQGRILAYCEKLRQNGKRLPHKDMKAVVSDETIRRWLATCTISNPWACAKRFDDVYRIKTFRPDRKWCEDILHARNMFSHRNGAGVAIDEFQLYTMIEKLKEFAIKFHEAFADEVNKLIKD